MHQASSSSRRHQSCHKLHVSKTRPTLLQRQSSDCSRSSRRNRQVALTPPVNLASKTDLQKQQQRKQVIETSKDNFRLAVNKLQKHKQLSSEIIEYKESQQNELEAERLLEKFENQEHYPFDMINDSAQLIDFLTQCKEVREQTKMQ